MAVNLKVYLTNAAVLISVLPASVSLAPLDTAQMAAEGYLGLDGFEVLTHVVAWATSDEDVATVSSVGLVTAIGAGSATISATLDGVSGTATVNVA